MTTLVLGPSLGTSAAACWGPTVDVLRAEPGDLEIVTWELPGHGDDRGPAPGDLQVGDLAMRALDAVDTVDTVDTVDRPFFYAGDSVGGQVGLELLLEVPDRVLGAVLCCTGAKIGDDEMWTSRVAQVRAGGTVSLLGETPARWFAPAFQARDPARAAALLQALFQASDDGYAAVCHALQTYDVRARLGEIARPVVAVAGRVDPVCPPDLLRQIADGVQHGRLVVLDDVAHQAPAEAPEHVARLIRELIGEVTP
jgi:3-oxoadipate enol-lactonase / 4-carboxymuconolactone decarboxylase